MNVNNEPIQNTRYSFYTKAGEKKMIRMDSKLIEKPLTTGKNNFYDIGRTTF